MLSKLLLTVDVNPETLEATIIKCEVQKDKTPSKKIINNESESLEPQITLESNKYILNQAAVELMGVAWEDRIDIKYQKIEGVTFPIIGTNIAFGTNGGNKLTKSNSVSCRGKANELLAKYGNTFSVTKMKGQDNLFVLVGNAEHTEEEVVDDSIEIKEDSMPEVDIPFEATIDADDTVELIDPLQFEL